MSNTEKIKEGIERRRFPRLNATVNVDYRVIDKKVDKEESVTKNISAGGICLILYEDLPVHSVLSLTISLPDLEEPIITKGRIVWKKDFSLTSDQRIRHDVGIEFIDIKEQDQKIISQYVFRFLA